MPSRLSPRNRSLPNQDRKPRTHANDGANSSERTPSSAASVFVCCGKLFYYSKSSSGGLQKSCGYGYSASTSKREISTETGIEQSLPKPTSMAIFYTSQKSVPETLSIVWLVRAHDKVSEKSGGRNAFVAHGACEKNGRGCGFCLEFEGL